MADEILKEESALCAHHTGLADEDAYAVIFNEKASASGLLSFAHGQIAILDSILGAMGRNDKLDGGVGDLADAARGMLAPAAKALELAVKRIPRGPTPNQA